MTESEKTEALLLREAKIAVRARIKQSLEDPRPTLTSEQVRACLDALYEKHRKSEDGQASV